MRFVLINETGNTCSKLKTLKQGDWTTEGYISDSCIHMSKSGIATDEALSEYSMDGLQLRLLEKIFTTEKLPVKTADWFIATLKYNSHWHCTKAIIEKIWKETLISNNDQLTSLITSWSQHWHWCFLVKGNPKQFTWFTSQPIPCWQKMKDGGHLQPCNLYPKLGVQYSPTYKPRP